MQKSMIFKALPLLLPALWALPVQGSQGAASSGAATFESRQLSALIDSAIENDAGKQQLEYNALAMEEMGVASSQWMDPKLKVGFGGLPVDSFALDQDPMTNTSIGLMQQFGRGDTLELQQKQAFQQAGNIRQQAGVRALDIEQAINTIWIELAYLNQSQSLLAQSRELVVELEQFLATNYGVGANHAQDVIQAQLQISKIDEKLQANVQQQHRLQAQLSEWIVEPVAEVLPKDYPQWQPLFQYLSANNTEHYRQFGSHPTLQAVDQLVASSKTGIDIANEGYQPQFGIEMMYANRQANGMNGQPAPDMVSVFLTMDIPIFTEKRQDRKLAAAQHQLGAAKSGKDLMLRQMNAKVNALLVDQTNTRERLSRYQDVLLKQAGEKTRAIERGYQNTTSQLDEYIGAANEELALKLEKSRLEANLHLVNNQLAYLLNTY